MPTLEYAKNPKYNSADGQQILLDVKWEEFPEEMPFNATSYDSMPYGVEIYNNAKNGDYGVVAPYVPPKE